MSERIKIRISLAVDHTGDWNAGGYRGQEPQDAFSYICDTLEPGEDRYYIDLEVDKPEQKVITIQSDDMRVTVVPTNKGD